MTDAVNERFYIGGVELPNRITLAPMAGYTDCAMRKLCAVFGAGLTVTEMVSAKGLCYNGEKSAQLLKTSPEEKVKCAQLFGHEPEFFAESLSNLPYLKKFDIIDINMGCPVPKIVKNGEGSALMKNPELAEKIVAACVKSAGGRPVTVKTRMGFDEGEFSAIDFCLRLQGAGAAAVTLHGRTRAGGYSGTADVKATEKLKNALDIPVIHSGDADENNVRGLLKIADAVAFGRGAIGNPQIFARLTGKSEQPEGAAQTLLTHLRYMTEFDGERYAVANIRKHVGYYLKGMTDVRDLKAKLISANSAEEFERALKERFPDVK